jgi:peptidoglycan/LPS O-acetylase OafA/YrhL
MSGSFPKQRLIELDGLRGFALIMILVFHCVSQEGEYPGRNIPFLLAAFRRLGWTALDLFFVSPAF